MRHISICDHLVSKILSLILGICNESSSALFENKSDVQNYQLMIPKVSYFFNDLLSDLQTFQNLNAVLLSVRHTSWSIIKRMLFFQTERAVQKDQVSFPHKLDMRFFESDASRLVKRPYSFRFFFSLVHNLQAEIHGSRLFASGNSSQYNSPTRFLAS